MTESNLGLPVHNPPHTSGAAGGAIGEQVQPEREEIVLKPSKEFPRAMTVEWDQHGVVVTLNAKNFQWLIRTRVGHAEVMLRAQSLMLLGEEMTIHVLRAGEASFHLSEREFETLRAKLGPRGVRVNTP